MPRPVLGTDPFAKPEVIGAAEPTPARAETSTPQPRAAKTSPSRTTRRSPRAGAVRRRVHASSDARPAADVDAKLAAMEERLERRIDETIDSRFTSLEAKLDAALTRLENGRGARTNGEDAPVFDESETSVDASFEDEGRGDESSFDESTDAEASVEASEDEDDAGGDEDFIGFLDDAPKPRAAADGSEEEFVGFLGEEFEDERRPPTFLGGLKDMFTREGFERALREVRMTGRSDEVDEFGKDPVTFARAAQFFDWMYEKYWRVETEGLEHLPDEGRGLIVGNHSGTLPFDGVMIATAARLHHPATREVRALAEDMFSTLPFIAPLMTRVGAVRACPENAERLLRHDELVVVFPEGVKGTGKYYRERYQLQRFGRGGFIKLCLRTGAPLIPVAVVGSEEIYPIIAKADWIGKPLGLPYTPITPTFPWFGLLGLVPLPTKWRIRFGEPMLFDEYGPDAIEDDILINHLKEDVRGRIQEMIDDMLADRDSVWFG